MNVIWRAVSECLVSDARRIVRSYQRQEPALKVLWWIGLITVGSVVLPIVVVSRTLWVAVVAYAGTRHPDSPQTQQRLLRRAQRDVWSQIAKLEKVRAELTDPRGRFVAEYRGVKLWELWLTTPTGAGPTLGARATCDAASNLVVTQRATLTRMAAGGLLLGPLGAVLSLGFQKKNVEDHRELYLLIEAPTFAGVVQCPPQDGATARRFAMAINLASSTSSEVLEQRPGQLAQIEAQLASLRTRELALVSELPRPNV
jgi:hypothetical protein